MNLYCWQHNAVHQVTEGLVERIVYALTGELSDALTDTEPLYAGEGSHDHLLCPLAALSASHDVEQYAELADQGVENRRHLARPSECSHCGGCPPPHHGWCGDRSPHGEHPLPDGRPCCGTTP